jgi:nitroimidazol reductase NimA-like FMN-containing flavoprotein (pyridoxamine 5'-phosphate oxidase superfamily)
MTTPVTTLDERYSDKGTTATSWDDTRRVLEEAELSWITTVRRDGRPHVTPVVAVWLGDALYFSTGDDEQKAVNLRSNPHVILTTGCNSWDSGLDVVVEGDAVTVTDQDLLRRLAQAWTRKWNGVWQYEVADGGFRHEYADSVVLVFEVAPTRVLAFAKGAYSHTKHRF